MEKSINYITNELKEIMIKIEKSNIEFKLLDNEEIKNVYSK